MRHRHRYWPAVWKAGSSDALIWLKSAFRAVSGTADSIVAEWAGHGDAAGIRTSRQMTQPNAQPYFVYILECRGGRLYTGITTDVGRRLAEHRDGRRGARFTRAHPPAALRASLQVADRSEALKLEAALKRLPRARKLEWIAQYAV